MSASFVRAQAQRRRRHREAEANVALPSSVVTRAQQAQTQRRQREANSRLSREHDDGGSCTDRVRPPSTVSPPDRQIRFTSGTRVSVPPPNSLDATVPFFFFCFNGIGIFKICCLQGSSVFVRAEPFSSTATATSTRSTRQRGQPRTGSATTAAATRGSEPIISPR